MVDPEFGLSEQLDPTLLNRTQIVWKVKATEDPDLPSWNQAMYNRAA